MLRNILILIGFVIAVDPYLGFPYSWQVVISTTLGVLIIVLLVLSKRPRAERYMSGRVEETPRSLHVERTVIEERPEVHVERETVLDAERVSESSDSETSIEREVTVVRRRRKKISAAPSSEFTDPQV